MLMRWPGRVLTLLLVWLVAQAAAYAEPRANVVAIDLSGLDDAAYARIDALTMQQRLMLRLVEEGYSIAGQRQPVSLSIRATMQGDRLSIAIVDGAGQRLLVDRISGLDSPFGVPLPGCNGDGQTSPVPSALYRLGGDRVRGW